MSTGVKLATTEDGVEELFRPVEFGWCRYESLVDGTLTLEDVAEMNDGIDLMLENKRRLEGSE